MKRGKTQLILSLELSSKQTTGTLCFLIPNRAWKNSRCVHCSKVKMMLDQGKHNVRSFYFSRSLLIIPTLSLPWSRCLSSLSGWMEAVCWRIRKPVTSPSPLFSRSYSLALSLFHFPSTFSLRLSLTLSLLVLSRPGRLSVHADTLDLFCRSRGLQSLTRIQSLYVRAAQRVCVCVCLHAEMKYELLNVNAARCSNAT